MITGNEINVIYNETFHSYFTLNCQKASIEKNIFSRCSNFILFSFTKTYPELVHLGEV